MQTLKKLLCLHNKMFLISLPPFLWRQKSVCDQYLIQQEYHNPLQHCLPLIATLLLTFITEGQVQHTEDYSSF